MLFTSLASIALVGGGALAIALQSALRADWRTAALAAVIVAITAARIAHVRSFRRERANTPLDLPRAKQWERQYAWGSYAVSAAVGVALFHVLAVGDPVLAMVVIGILVVYVFGLVLRLSIRPVICAVSALIVIGPVSAGLLFYIPDGRILTPASAGTALAIIVGIVTASAFEMMRYTYCLALDQLVARRDLSHMARQDPLTGLPNRISLRERFDEELASIGRGALLAIHYIDLDDFKAVNDTHGHQIGDALLRQVANRMTVCVRAGDMVARLGGDEFVVVQSGLQSDEEAADLARRVIASVSEPYTIGTLRVRVGATIGIALAPRHGSDLDGLVACADAALYRAKASGRGQFEFCTDTPAGERKVA